jgi:hypothetical protein
LQSDPEPKISGQRKVIRRPAPPFFKLSHCLVLHYASKVKPAALIVYAGVLLHTNKNRQAWPSLRTIADMCGYRWCPAVSRALDELIDVGALSRQHQRRTTILFTFPVAKFSPDKFTIITKAWLRELVSQVDRTSAGVYLILLAIAAGRRHFSKKVDDILPLLKLSPSQFDRSVAKLVRCGLVQTRHGVVTEWTMLENPGAKSAKTAFLDPSQTAFLNPSKTALEVDLTEVDISEADEDTEARLSQARSARARESPPSLSLGKDRYTLIRDHVLECCGKEASPVCRRDSAMIRQLDAATDYSPLEDVLSFIDEISDMIMAKEGEVDPSRILKIMLKFLREGEWPGVSGIL